MKKWFETLKSGLSKSSNRISSTLSNIFLKRKLDIKTLEELEDLLITSDIGFTATEQIISKLKKNKFDKEVTNDEIKQELACELTNILDRSQSNSNLGISNQLEIVLICGVNGNGKTTTIGKLANYYHKQNKKIAVAACDTFRAAAVQQLEIWANRADIKFISGKDKADPASVAHNAVSISLKEQIDILFIDTAGRLQNNVNLMEELNKINKVVAKLIPDAPHHSILILDATTGQNAFSQVENFSKIVKISGLIVTKLDGTAKAGVIVGLSDKFKLPIYAIGVGEAIDDLQPFVSSEFANSLVGL